MLRKLKLWHIGAIAFVLLLLYAGYVTERNKVLSATVEERDKEVEELTTFATKQKEATTFYINKYRQEVARVKSHELSLANINRLLNTREFEQLKQFEGLKNDNRNLKASLAFYASMNADSILMNPFTVECDSNKLKGWKWELIDEYNHISATVLDTPLFKSKVPIKAVILEGKRTKSFIGLFRYGPRSIDLEAISLNKLVPIDSINFTRVRQK